jgi:hypothetical protein
MTRKVAAQNLDIKHWNCEAGVATDAPVMT